MRPLASRAWIVFVLFAVLVILFGVFPGPWFEAGDIIDFVFAAIGVVALLISQPRSLPTRGPDRL